MIKYLNFIGYIILFVSTSFSQTSDTLTYKEDFKFKVDSIKISGNDITEDYIILKELNFKEGDVVSKNILKFNEERIFSLKLFTKVKLHTKKSNKKNIVIINVNESWYIFPFPILKIKDRDVDKISYGLALSVFNFRGRNEKIRFVGSLGYNPKLDLTYFNPYLINLKNISFQTVFRIQEIRNVSHIAKRLFGSDFDQNIRSGSVSFGKRFNVYNRASISTSFTTIEAPKFIKGISASDSRIDHLFSLNFGYTFDSRDLAQFPSQGFYFSSLLQLKGLGIDNIDYQVLNFDVRKYFKVSNNLTFKWRFASRYTFGKLIPFYDYSLLGFGERIRGHFNQELEGNNSYISTIEFVYPVIKELNLSLDFIPFIPSQLLNYRIALYLQFFADTGLIQNKNEPLSLNKLNSGYGIGLTLLFLPYNVFRLEYAWDEYKNKEWIFDVGVSF